MMAVESFKNLKDWVQLHVLKMEFYEDLMEKRDYII